MSTQIWHADIHLQPLNSDPNFCFFLIFFFSQTHLGMLNFRVKPHLSTLHYAMLCASASTVLPRIRTTTLQLTSCRLVSHFINRSDLPRRQEDDAIPILQRAMLCAFSVIGAASLPYHDLAVTHFARRLRGFSKGSFWLYRIDKEMIGTFQNAIWSDPWQAVESVHFPSTSPTLIRPAPCSVRWVQRQRKFTRYAHAMPQQPVNLVLIFAFFFSFFLNRIWQRSFFRVPSATWSGMHLWRHRWCLASTPQPCSHSPSARVLRFFFFHHSEATALIKKWCATLQHANLSDLKNAVGSVRFLSGPPTRTHPASWSDPWRAIGSVRFVSRTPTMNHLPLCSVRWLQCQSKCVEFIQRSRSYTTCLIFFSIFFFKKLLCERLFCHASSAPPMLPCIHTTTLQTLTLFSFPLSLRRDRIDKKMMHYIAKCCLQWYRKRNCECFHSWMSHPPEPTLHRALSGDFDVNENFSSPSTNSPGYHLHALFFYHSDVTTLIRRQCVNLQNAVYSGTENTIGSARLLSGTQCVCNDLYW